VISYPAALNAYHGSASSASQMPVGVPPSAEAEVTTRRTFLGEDMLAGEKKRAVVIKVQY